jgi:hypothetical protein
MPDLPKSVADMTAEEYYEYLMSLSDSDFIRAVAHDIKKVTSVAHGYISLIRLDIDEDCVDTSRLSQYTNMMETMIEKSYLYVDAARAAFTARYLS